MKWIDCNEAVTQFVVILKNVEVGGNNMEVTNEIKAKVFAQYYGQQIKLNNEMIGQMYAIQTYKSHDEPAHVEVLIGNVCVNYSIDKMKLLLKPISSITDEDAIEVCTIIGSASHLSKESQAHQAKELLQEVAFYTKQTNIVGASWCGVLQFLQSRGYDLPNWYLGGKTLNEAGLAIYE